MGQADAVRKCPTIRQPFRTPRFTPPAMIRRPIPLLVRVWLVTAVVDAIFSSALNVFAYHSTVALLWQRVASTLLGPDALNGGSTTVFIGLLMHAGVALTWSAVFLILAMRWAGLRRVIGTPAGVLAVAALYGPAIWMVMSFVVIPTATGRPPTINTRWWVQFFGHIPFVALPIVGVISGGEDAPVGDPATSRRS